MTSCNRKLKKRMTFIIVEHGANENLILNPDCCCKTFLNYIRKICNVNPEDVVDLIDENAQVSELFLKNPSENLNSMFTHRGVYILASIEMYEDNTIKKITPLLQDWQKKYHLLEKLLELCDRRHTNTEHKPAPQPHPKEAKERKFLRRLSNKTHNGPTAGRKESKSPDVTSSPKKTKKKLKIVI